MPHFEPEEVLSPALQAVFKKTGAIPYSTSFLLALERLRCLSGHPIIVNVGDLHLRGGRSPLELVQLNRELERPEDTYSFHLWCAADVSSTYYSPRELFNIAVRHDLFTGYGIYKTFLHVDQRPLTFSGPFQFKTK